MKLGGMLFERKSGLPCRFSLIRSDGMHPCFTFLLQPMGAFPYNGLRSCNSRWYFAECCLFTFCMSCNKMVSQLQSYSCCLFVEYMPETLAFTFHHLSCRSALQLLPVWMQDDVVRANGEIKGGVI